MKRVLYFTIVTLFFSSCSKQVWEKTPKGVVVHPKSKTESSARTISLEVVNDEIIHVLASPTDQFSSAKSLCVVDQPANPDSV